MLIKVCPQLSLYMFFFSWSDSRVSTTLSQSSEVFWPGKWMRLGSKKFIFSGLNIKVLKWTSCVLVSAWERKMEIPLVPQLPTCMTTGWHWLHSTAGGLRHDQQLAPRWSRTAFAPQHCWPCVLMPQRPGTDTVCQCLITTVTKTGLLHCNQHGQ